MFGFGFSNAEEFERLEQKKKRRKFKKKHKKADPLNSGVINFN
jgi:hypothetical protein